MRKESIKTSDKFDKIDDYISWVFEGIDISKKFGSNSVEIKLSSGWYITAENLELELLKYFRNIFQSNYPNDSEAEYLAVTVPCSYLMAF